MIPFVLLYWAVAHRLCTVIRCGLTAHASGWTARTHCSYCIRRDRPVSAPAIRIDAIFFPLAFKAPQNYLLLLFYLFVLVLFHLPFP